MFAQLNEHNHNDHFCTKVEVTQFGNKLDNKLEQIHSRES